MSSCISTTNNKSIKFINNFIETIDHIFWTCREVSMLWDQLNDWIFQLTEIELPLNLSIVLFGFIEKTDKNYIRNIVILLTKFFIYRTKLCEVPINFQSLKNYLKENLFFEKNVFYQTHTIEESERCWNPWLPIL